MRHFIERILKYTAGLLILPGVYVAAVVLLREVEGAPLFSGSTGYFIQGVIGYLFIHAVLWEPTGIYVVGHELTHALCGLLFFARIKKFKISRSGGSVTLSKSNFFISLGPYLIPFYTLVICLGFLIMRVTGHAYQFINVFLVAAGFSWAMHLVMTIKFIRMKQPDLIHTGQFFSLCLIALVNVLVLAGLLSWVVPGFEYIPYMKQAALDTRQAYQALFAQLFLVPAS